MTGKTHVAIGVASSTAVVSIILKQDINVVDYATIMTISSFGALLPDIDHAGSTIGNKVPILARMFKHRGFTHTLLCAILMFFVFNFLILKVPITGNNIVLGKSVSLFGFNLLSQISIYSIIFIVGYISHLLADCLTPEGLTLFKGPFGIFDHRIVFSIVQSPEIEKIIYLGCIIITPFFIAGF